MRRAIVCKGVRVFVELIDLMLGEESDFELFRFAQGAGQSGQPAGEQFGESRFAVAIGAEQSDAIVFGDRQREAPQYDGFAIAGRGVFHGDDRRPQRFFRGRQIERQDIGVDERRHRLHLCEQFEARLGLSCFRRFGAETVDEGLNALALVFLLFSVLLFDRELLAALPLEARIIAAPERQLAMIEMENVIGDGIEEIAVMADDEDHRRIAPQVVDEPERAFEIEIIGRLVEQQKIRRRKQNGGERDAHPPAAGKLRQGPLLRLRIEAEARRDVCRAGRR